MAKPRPREKGVFPGPCSGQVAELGTYPVAVEPSADGVLVTTSSLHSTWEVK